MNIKPSWNIAPEWAKYLAQDGDGTWYWYQDKPYKSQAGTRVWIRGSNNSLQAKAVTDDDAWELTLEKRP